MQLKTKAFNPKTGKTRPEQPIINALQGVWIFDCKRVIDFWPNLAIDSLVGQWSLSDDLETVIVAIIHTDFYSLHICKLRAMLRPTH